MTLLCKTMEGKDEKLYCRLLALSLFWKSAPEVLGDPWESDKDAHGVGERGFIGVACTLKGCSPSLCTSSGIPNDAETF